MSKAQQEIYDFIVAYRKNPNQAPSLRDMREVGDRGYCKRVKQRAPDAW